MQNDLLALEKQGWDALCAPGDAGRRFYDAVLHDDVVMLFPGGLRLEGKSEVLSSIAPQAWASYQIEDAKAVALAEGAEVLAYKVAARREGEPPYVALISSTYVKAEGAWRLVFHQHTPV